MRPRIIILEDDTSTREALSAALASRGYEVLSAAEPVLCPLYCDLDARCEHEFACGDLLLSDNHMPRMTGLQFVTRQGERGCKGVVHNKALVSGDWREEDLAEAGRLGCRIFTKPYKLDDVFSWIEERIRTIPPGRRLAELGRG